MEPRPLVLSIHGAAFGLRHSVEHLANEAHQLVDFDKPIFLCFHLLLVCGVERLPVLSQNEDGLGSDRRRLVVLH